MVFVNEIVKIGGADFASSPTLEALLENRKSLRKLSFMRERQELDRLLSLFLREFRHALYSTACLTIRIQGTWAALARTAVPWNEPVRTRVTTGVAARSTRDR